MPDSEVIADEGETYERDFYLFRHHVLQMRWRKKRAHLTPTLLICENLLPIAQKENAANSIVCMSINGRKNGL